MSKNKINWIIAMVLITTFVIPVAHAQGFSMFGYGVANIKFFLVNAAVIFFVLFILQAFLVPGKERKEKTSMWVIMIFASLLISYLYGQAGYVWQVGPLALIFNYYVLGNALIIGVVLYFVFGLLKINEKLGGNKEGNLGYMIIITLISLFIAVKLGNRWVWDTSVIQQIYSYLFVIDSQGYGGILTFNDPTYKLGTLIGSFTILAFFFNGFLLKEGVGDKKNTINYMLAAVFALNLANNGVSINAVLRLGEIVFILMIERALKGSIEKSTWGRWIVAILLVCWAEFAITSGTQYSGLIGWMTNGAISGVKWTFKTLIIATLQVLGIFVIYRLISSLVIRFLPAGTPAVGGVAPVAGTPPVIPPVAGAPAVPPALGAPPAGPPGAPAPAVPAPPAVGARGIVRRAWNWIRGTP